MKKLLLAFVFTLLASTSFAATLTGTIIDAITEDDISKKSISVTLNTNPAKTATSGREGFEIENFAPFASSTITFSKKGYNWIQYVSLEHEIESRKNEYYIELRKCQAERPNEDVTSWINFFFDALMNIQDQLMKKLETKGIKTKLSPRDKSIFMFIENNAGTKSGNIAKKLNIPNPTVKRILTKLVNENLIEKFGIGAGTNYAIQ